MVVIITELLSVRAVSQELFHVLYTHQPMSSPCPAPQRSPTSDAERYCLLSSVCQVRCQLL